MSEISPQLIEKYQLLHQKDPQSKVFAPLAEAYRKMGWLKEAREVCESGVKNHPHFSGGRVALAKILIDQKLPAEAIEQLEIATEAAPENLLAQQLLADLALKLKKPKLALKAYKMLLLLNPSNAKAAEVVKKLESLTADEYDEDVFSMRKITDTLPPKKMASQGKESGQDLEVEIGQKPSAENAQLERYLSLTDAYIVRNDSDKAFEVLKEAERLLGPHAEFNRRHRLLNDRFQIEIDPVAKDDSLNSPPLQGIEESRKTKEVSKKLDFLKKILQQLEERERHES